MFNSKTKNVIMSAMTAALIATALSTTSAMAIGSGGGGGGDRAQETAADVQVSKNDTRHAEPAMIIPVPSVWESILFPGPMPGGRGNDR